MEAPSRGLLPTLRAIVELAKIRITVAVCLTVAMGHVLFAEAIGTDVLLPILGVFLLACGSATLNHVQDAKVDARMERTKSRPIPSGRISREWALFVAVLFVSAGLYVVASIEVHTVTLVTLGLLAVFWYNGVYTPLKRVTAFAIIPGSLIGAIPPVIGWASAGGLWWDPFILEVAFFLYLWQIPHFWCLMLMKSEDYERGGLPTISKLLTRLQVGRVTAMWVLTLAVAGVILAGKSEMYWPWHAGMLLASAWLAWNAYDVLRNKREQRIALPAFMRINLYLLAVILCLAGNAMA